MEKIVKFIVHLLEILNILKIIAAPFIIGLVVAFVFHLYKPDIIGQTISVIIALIGLALGILLVRKVRQTKTATEFNARVYASPDLNNLSNKKKL